MQFPNGFQIEVSDGDLIIRKHADNNAGSPFQGELRISAEALLDCFGAVVNKNPDIIAEEPDASLNDVESSTADEPKSPPE